MITVRRNLVTTMFMMAACSVVSLGAAAIVDTSFEAGEGYTADSSPDGVDNWSVSGDTVTVRTGTDLPDGNQYLELGQGAILDYIMDSAQTAAAGNLVWVEGYFRGQGSTATLSEALGNYPTTEASAIVHFSDANGIEALDGDGSGGGTVESLNVALGAGNASNWYKVTLQIDFSQKNWNVWVDNDQKNSTPLGFRNASVVGLNGFKNLAEQSTSFDAFRVVRPTPGDANGDAKVDSADITELVNYVSGTDLNLDGDIILFTNGNVNTVGNSAGAIDQDDISSLAQRLAGYM